MKYQLAQMNVTTLVDLPGHESNAEFLPVLETVNAIAEVSPGFVGRLKDESGQSSAFITSDGDPNPARFPIEDPKVPLQGELWSRIFPVTASPISRVPTLSPPAAMSEVLSPACNTDSTAFSIARASSSSFSE